jgi:glycine cleavage system H protein
MGGIHQNGKSLKIFSPVSGEIIAINPRLHTAPELIGKDPYSTGWFYKIKPHQWKEETGSLYLAEEAVRWSEKELERFKNFLTHSVNKYQPDMNHFVLQDGGELIHKPLTELPGEIWEDFQKEFLNV